MALTLEQSEKLRKLIRCELELRYKAKIVPDVQMETSIEVLQERKEKLVGIFESRMLVNSISRGLEAPSAVADFKDRGFHDKLSLFNF